MSDYPYGRGSADPSLPMNRPADQSGKVDTSDEACALICMIVSNPGGVMQKPGWQKRVNDLIRALCDERNALKDKP